MSKNGKQIAQMAAIRCAEALGVVGARIGPAPRKQLRESGYDPLAHAVLTMLDALPEDRAVVLVFPNEDRARVVLHNLRSRISKRLGAGRVSFFLRGDELHITRGRKWGK